MAPEFGKPIQQLPLSAGVLKKHRAHEPLDTRFGPPRVRDQIFRDPRLPKSAFTAAPSSIRSGNAGFSEVRPLLTRTQRIPFSSITGRD